MLADGMRAEARDRTAEGSAPSSLSVLPVGLGSLFILPVEDWARALVAALARRTVDRYEARIMKDEACGRDDEAVQKKDAQVLK